MFPSDDNINEINSISLIDFGKLKDSGNQFNIGIQKNNINNSYYFSMDKLISHNLVGSIKISLLKNNELEVYNQNSFLFSGKDNPLNFIIAINYLMSNFKVDRWFNIGVIFDLFRNNYLLDDNFFIGVYSDIDTNLQGINNFNYYFRIKKELTKKILIS